MHVVKPPLITIGVLNHNGVRRLRRCLPSLLHQEYPNVQLLVADNGSSDGSVEYLQHLRVKTIYFRKNRGYGCAKNELVRQAKGDYVFLLDNDIECPNNAVQQLLFDYRELGDTGFLSPLVQDIDKNTLRCLGLKFTRLQSHLHPDDLERTGILRVNGFHGGAVFFKRQLFCNLGGYDDIFPIHLDDYDLSARAALQQVPCFASTNVKLIHHGVEISDSRLQFRQKFYLAGFSRMMWKNYSWPNLLLWFPAALSWILVKALRVSLHHQTPTPLFGVVQSAHVFLCSFPSTLRMRKTVQASRTVREDVFLNEIPAK
ncbi:glycosyltransferase [Candidatus Woesearchaeota archaeon]|nr:glycosyltransferase [Candidatus Woesearchaeota archaeon]